VSSRPAAEDGPLVEFRCASVILGGGAALDRVSLVIGRREHVAILGPNGSGKSTLVRTLAGDLLAAADGVGSVRVLGRDRWSLFEVRRHLGIVSDDLQASCDRPVTVRRLVLGGFFGSLGIFPHQTVTPAMAQRADEVLAFLGIHALAERRMDSLSTGQARRALIGRALVHRPETLVLDEPFDGLDPQARYHLRELLRQLAREGTGLVLVTHDISDVVPEIGRVVTLSAGRVATDLPKAEALTAERLSELFGYPAEVTERDGYYRLW
jgi:iron complex transport system ATP-binding protein